MAESPDLAGSYHLKLDEVYETEDKLRDPDVLKQSKEQLAEILDEVERKLNESTYIAGDEFTMANVMLIPVLARIVLLDLEEEYICSRPNIAEYWNLVQQRPSYKKVIGKYFSGWRKYKTLLKTWCFVRVINLLIREGQTLLCQGPKFTEMKGYFATVVSSLNVMRRDGMVALGTISTPNSRMVSAFAAKYVEGKILKIDD
ncbi:Glutathione S-transferase TCHQD [Vitis vinifera]|uniref:Glutathione S-transferase TCHQD n=1 Tax=Vitis vinifera TaxID=29760 RepID=A0A438EU18_VITVI|nr:Glutathione S-transferase TCHQD [Vitis vinifera]